MRTTELISYFCKKVSLPFLFFHETLPFMKAIPFLVSELLAHFNEALECFIKGEWLWGDTKHAMCSMQALKPTTSNPFFFIIDESIFSSVFQTVHFIFSVKAKSSKGHATECVSEWVHRFNFVWIAMMMERNIQHCFSWSSVQLISTDVGDEGFYMWRLQIGYKCDWLVPVSRPQQHW